ncbi:cyclin-dependent protein kinase [Pseudoneurospora amorphoporcata]|uniref:Cyclin-dependent protein kinase n=1 Tax=Pseudoneurospora amorphoporcata TaxID=241081 RepID=A0AAN6NSR7_9PEZI|nr:cyclin-dependent protein kinase [Pseudoneurospora amorphoporcata]
MSPNPEHSAPAPTDPPAADAEQKSDSSAPASPPPAPVPSADPRLFRQITQQHTGDSDDQVDDIYKVSPLAALKLLSAGIETLVSLTGDIPPTPPPRSPTIPHMRGMEAEKQSIVRSNSAKNLTSLLQNKSATNSPRRPFSPAPQRHSRGEGLVHKKSESIDGVQLRTPTNPTSSTRPDLQPYIVVGENSQPLNTQHSAITRKFYSRLPPPISITDYLLRIHQYCPMSTAVYLAASLYIHRLAIIERAIVVTKRNAHRLLLAGIRVAMKALEDLSYPHGKFAKVGGVSETELARLEISFCFLVGFELRVDEEALRGQWDMLKSGVKAWEGVEHDLYGKKQVFTLRNPPPGRDGRHVQAQAAAEA